MQSIIDYLKYDNKYWNERTKKNLKKRLLVYSLSCLIFFEGYTIFKKEPLPQSIIPLVNKINIGTKELLKDFPMRALAYANVLKSREYKLDKSELSDYLDNLSTKAQIKGLIKKDNRINYSEIGGLAILVENDNCYSLRFIEMEGLNMKLCKDIINNIDNKDYLEQIFESKSEVFKKMYGGGGLYEKVLANIKKGNRSDFFLNLSISNYLSHSDSIHELSNDQVINMFYPGVMPGQFVAMFHIHNDLSPPIEPDLEASKVMREFVISTNNAGFTLYDLVDGRINAEITKQF